MKRWYNGFRFSPDVETTVYNPISVALTLDEKSANGFKATWAATGRPSMLMNYLKREDVLRIDPERMRGITVAEFDVAELRRLKPVAMLCQSGYLTIKEYNPATELYTLGVPDEEVRRDLCTLMTGAAANTDMQWASSLGGKLLAEMWDYFFDGLQSLYAGMAYGSTEGRVHENSYGRCLSFLLASQGFRFTMENVQSNGRADVVAEHPARAEGGRADRQGVRADPREGVRRAVQGRSAPRVARRPFVRLPYAPPRRLRGGTLHGLTVAESVFPLDGLNCSVNCSSVHWRFPNFSGTKIVTHPEIKDEVSFSFSRQVKTPFPIILGNSERLGSRAGPCACVRGCDCVA